MFEFKVIENLKPNKDLTGILKESKYKVKLGQIKTILYILTILKMKPETWKYMLQFMIQKIQIVD